MGGMVMEMYIGKTCPFCHERLKYNDAVVACSECNTFHHESCWNENRGCTTYQCHGNSVKVSGVTVGRDISPSMQSGYSNTIFCSRCGTENMKSSGSCVKCGFRLGHPASGHTQSTYSNSHTSYNNSYYSSDEGLEAGEKVGICLGNICLSPLLGIILYFVWKDDKPKKAEDVCSITILSVFAPFILAFIFSLLGLFSI